MKMVIDTITMRDFRREQQLEEENEKIRNLKWLIAIIAILLIIVAVFATRAILNNNSSDNQQTNNASNDNNVSKDYKMKFKTKVIISNNK